MRGRCEGEVSGRVRVRVIGGRVRVRVRVIGGRVRVRVRVRVIGGRVRVRVTSASQLPPRRMTKPPGSSDCYN